MEWGIQAWSTLPISQTTPAVTNLNVIWNDKNIAISCRVRLTRSLAMSTFLYACETWTITADIERIQALEMRCFRKLLGISYRDHITNGEVRARIGNANGSYEDLLTSVKKDANWSGTGTSHDHLDRPRLSYREQFKEGDEDADRGYDRKTTSKSGLTLNGLSYYGKPRTTRSGGIWL